MMHSKQVKKSFQITFSSLRDTALVVWFCLLTLAFCSAGVEQKPKESVSREDWGKVIGRVYDAETGNPIVGATVIVEDNGVFDTTKKQTVGTTDQTGRYECKARIGKVSSHIDIRRLLQTGLLVSILTGSPKKETKKVDISRLNLRVSKVGYKTFEGVVVCRSVDAEKFFVEMHPIWLVRQDSEGISTVAEGWAPVEIMHVSVDPPIGRPDEAIKITARLRCPPVPKQSMVKVGFVSDFFGSKELRLERSNPDGIMLFSQTVKIPKKPKTKVGWVSVDVWQCPYEVRSSRRSEALVQVAQTEGERKAAQLRLEAWQLCQDDKNEEAFERLVQLTQLPEALVSDFRDLANVSEQLHRYDEMANALRRAVELTPEKERITLLARYGEALLLAGQTSQAIQALEPPVKNTPEKDRPKKLPLGIFVILGRALMEQGNLTKAEEMAKAIDQWMAETSRRGGKDTARIIEKLVWEEEVTAFRQALRLQRAQAAVQANPNDANALANYGRTLADFGRWEEAAQALQQALTINPNLKAVHWDLSYVLLRLKGAQAAALSLEKALAEAEEEVGLAKEEKHRSKDFRAWHRLAVLRYRKARQEEEQGLASAQKTLEQAKAEFKEALKWGRAGAVEKLGEYSYYFGWTSPAVRAIAGFAYPEADADYVLLDSLDVLSQHPDNYLAWFNLGTALIDLGQHDLAESAIKKCLELNPEFAEAHYAQAVIHMQLGRNEEAEREIELVLKVNPRHPHANKTMAKLLTERGELERAAAYLATHAKYYGSR